MATSDEDTTTSSDTSSMIPALNEFHLFPKLANELKDMIFEHALLPQLIRVDLEGGNLAYARIGSFEVARTALKLRSLNSSLRSVCHQSESVESKELAVADMYVFATRSSFDINPASISKPIACRPQSDTLLFPDIMPFCHMAWYGALGKESESDTLARNIGMFPGLAEITSVAIGGTLERVWSVPRLDLPFCDTLWFSTYPDGRNSLSRLFSWLPNLQEVIIVSPTVQQLCEKRVKLKQRSEGLGNILNRDVTECSRNIKLVVEGFSRCLEREGKELLKEQRKFGLNVPADTRRGRPATVSDWWKDPVVIWLTESELKARFGLDPSIDLKTGPQIPGVPGGSTVTKDTAGASVEVPPATEEGAESAIDAAESRAVPDGDSMTSSEVEAIGDIETEF